MASTHVKMPIRKAAKHLTVTVSLTGVRVWRIRLWIGLNLIALGARVIGCGLKVEP